MSRQGLRDRQYGKCEWVGREFSVIDTGGWVVNTEDVFEEEIKRHVTLALEESDVVLFVVDVQTGISDLDNEVAAILRRTDKPVIVVSNKSDTFDWQCNAAEFYALGLGDPFIVSAINGGYGRIVGSCGGIARRR